MVEKESKSLLYEGKNFKVELDSKGLFHYTFIKDSYLRTSDVKEYHAFSTKLSKQLNKPIPAVLRAPGSVGLTLEARKVLSAKLVEENNFSFKAFLAEEKENWMLISLLIEMLPCLSPTQVFANEKMAVQWIDEHLQDSAWDISEVRKKLNLKPINLN